MMAYGLLRITQELLQDLEPVLPQEIGALLTALRGLQWDFNAFSNKQFF
jgi:hypothetical protein